MGANRLGFRKAEFYKFAEGVCDVRLIGFVGQEFNRATLTSEHLAVD